MNTGAHSVHRLRALVVAFIATASALLIAPGPGEVVQAEAASPELFATSIGYGFGSTCASTSDLDMWCWGDAGDGGLANGTGGGIAGGGGDNVQPVPVRASIGEVVQTSGTCALVTNGDVRCWGRDGIIEDGTGSLFTEPPWGSSLPIGYGFDKALQVAGSCARLVSGGVQCYGWGAFGELGNGAPGWPETAYSLPPPSAATAVDVVGLNDVVDLTAGRGFLCAAESDGSVWCWGRNIEGELGDGQSGNENHVCGGSVCPDFRYESAPIRVLGIDDAIDVEQNCAIRQGGRVSCWGENAGGRFDPSASGNTMFAPIEIPAFAGARDLTVSSRFACAVLATGNVTCQGSGALGDGGDATVSGSVDLDFANAREIHETCVIGADGSISCWGFNFGGTLGLGFESPALDPIVRTPTFVVGFTGGGTPPPSDAPTLASLDPGRVLDTRPNGETTDGEAQGEGRVPADSFIELDVLGRSGVPGDDVAAAILNITAINPSGRGFVTAFPCGDRPTASSLNYAGAGGVIANEVIAKLSAAGTVCLYTSAETHLAADVVGYLPSSSELSSLNPARLLDTRPSGETVAGGGAAGGRVPGGSFVEVQVAGRAGVPASGAGAAIINITAINPSERGFVTAFPCGERPTASSLNFAGAGGVIANELIAKLSATGTLCLYTSAETHLAADVVGFLPSSSSLVSLDPQRVLDSRPNGETVDGKFAGNGRIGSNTVEEIPISGRAGVVGASSVIINVTAINPSERGFVAVYPCETFPTASSLNYAGAGGVIANELVAKLSDDGTVCITSSAETHLAIDVVGFLPS